MGIKTALSSIEDVKNILTTSDVSREVSLTGGIYSLIRLLNSKKEDVVINSIVSESNQITENILNINVHVPNLAAIPAGSPNMVDNGQPDILRMKEIGEAVANLLRGYRGFDFFIEIVSEGEIIPDGKNWYYNIVIRYFFLQRDN